MKKILILLSLAIPAQAANYLSLASGLRLYDVEIIVFDRDLPQLNSHQVSQKPVLDLTELNAMEPADPELPRVKSSAQDVNGQNDDQWQVPLNDQGRNVEALAWFAISNNGNSSPVFNRINSHPQMQALFYQKWRQPATPYTRPGYVKISNWPEDAMPNESETTDTMDTFVGSLHETEKTITPKSDGTFRGQVAFSKRRFHHAHVNMNLFKQGADGEMITHNIKQNTQIDLGKWQYFDHQQFGIMMKVTPAQL